MNTEKDYSFGQAAPTVVFDNTTPCPFHPEVTLRQLIENWAQYETLSELCLREPEEMQAQYLDTVKSFYDTAYACLRRLLLLTRKDPKNENGVQLSQLYHSGDNQILSIESLVKGKRPGSDQIHHLLFEKARIFQELFVPVAKAEPHSLTLSRLARICIEPNHGVGQLVVIFAGDLTNYELLEAT